MSDEYITLTKYEFQQYLDQAAETGAERALKKVGLHDESAHTDIKTLRDLLDWLRDVRSFTARRLVLFVLKTVLFFALIGVAVKSGILK